MSSTSGSASARYASGTSSVGYNAVGDQLIQFGGGLDVNTDPYILDPPYTTTATDVFYISPGQLQALPLVSNIYPQINVQNVYAAGALPAYDPIQTGSAYEIAEVSRPRIPPGQSATSARYAPQMLVRDYNGADPPAPATPVLPYTTKTRSAVSIPGGPSGTYYSDAFNSAQTVTTPVLTHSLLDPSRVVSGILNYSAVTSLGYVTLDVVDQNGSVLSPTSFNLTLPSSFNASVQMRLISDQTNAGKHYLLAYQPGSTGTYQIAIYTLTVQSNNNNQNSVALTADAGTLLTGGPSNFGGLDTLYTNGQASFIINNATSGFYWVPLAPTSNSTIVTQPITTYNGAAYKLWTISGMSSVTSLAAASTVQFSTAFSNYIIMVAVSGKLYRLVVNTSQTLQSSSSVSITGNPQTIEVRPQGGSTMRAIGAVFAHNVEAFTGLTTYGYATATQYVQQIAVSYFTDTGSASTVEASTPFRSIQGAMVVSKAFTFNRDDKYNSPGNVLGNPTDAFYCNVLLGATVFDGYYTTQTFFTLDHLGNVVSRFSELQTPQIVYTNSGYTGSSTVFSYANGLSLPFWLINPNDNTLFEIGVPFVSPNFIQENIYKQQPNFTPGSLSPSQGQSLLQIPSSAQPSLYNGGSVSFITFSQSALGVMCPAAQKGKATLLSGGLTMEYDGRTLHESGFHLPSTFVGPPNFTTTSAVFPTGTFIEYQCLHSWTDATGLRHISNISPTRVVNPPTAGANKITMFVPSPVFTYKTPASDGINLVSSVSCEVYKTFDASGVIYLAGTVSVPMGANAPFGSGILSLGSTFQDTVNTYPPGQVSPYTNGNNEYTSDPPPPFIWTVNSQGRAFGLACVNSTYRIYFSGMFTDSLNTLTVQDQSPRWNGTGYVTCPFELGDVRSIAQLDTSVFAFGTRNIGLFTGSGPQALQLPSGASFFQTVTDLNYTPVAPIPIPAGVVGCGSPITVPNGILYHDRQGISLMDRSQRPEFLGLPIDSITTSTRYGIPMLFPQLQIVVFPNNTGLSLVCDYNGKSFAQWSSCGNVASGYVRQDGQMFMLQSSILSSQGALASTQTVQVFPAGITPSVSPSVYSQMVVETPWISVGQGFAGEGDLWDMVLLGKYIQPHTLKIEAAYNYGNYSQTTNFSPGTDTSLPTLPYQYRVRPRGGARFQTVRYRITVMNIAGGQCECARLTGIMLWSANYRGLNRMGATASR